MKRGVPMQGVEKSPIRRAREVKKRKAEEQRWAARSGPVTVIKLPHVVKRSPEQPPQEKAPPER